jgi:hypothetical protein
MKAEAKGSSALVIQLKRPYGIFALAALLFGGAAAFFFHRAGTNDRGLIINGIIELSPGAADIFYAVFGVLSAGMGGMGALSILKCASLKEFRILVDKSSIKMPPAPLWKAPGEVTVPIDRVVAVEANHVALTLREDDAAHAIPARWLPSGWTPEEAARAIIERIQKARQATEKKKASEAKVDPA